MSGDRKKIIYWDTCVYLAWLKEEAAYASYLPTIAAISQDNTNGRNIIVTSVITLTEVLEHKLSPTEEKRFLDSFHYGQHHAYDVDWPVAIKARNVRSYYATNRQNGKMPGVSDSIHLSTALILKVDEFQTFDDGGQDGFSLLALKDNVAGESMTIRMPHHEQAQLI